MHHTRITTASCRLMGVCSGISVEDTDPPDSADVYDLEPVTVRSPRLVEAIRSEVWPENGPETQRSP